MTKKIGRLVTDGRVKINTYEVIARAVEDGIGWGLTRAFKHTETPDRETLEDHLHREILNAICEVVIFDDSREET